MSALPEGFVLHDGGLCPYRTGCHDVILRNGVMALVSHSAWRWHHDGSWSDIIAYRPTSKQEG